MTIHKSPVTAISSLGLATGGAVALHPIMPTIQRFTEQGFIQRAIAKFWNYLLILAAVIIEGPLATVLGGAWAAMGRVNFWGVLLIALLAGVLADSFWYYFGYFGREQVISRWGRYVRIDVEAINKMEEVLFGQDGPQVLFVAKLTSALIIPALIAAGMTRMGWRKVMRTIIPAQFLWSVGLTGIGFVMADSYKLISQKVENLAWPVGVVAGLFLVSYIIYRWRKANERFTIY